ncbi:glycine betaine ABC transporter substrate-binding protein [Chitinispirillales bacterium ANBcel5]|uniref:glycine betaine ABC transporter substrate-binding protein n=1 Tax=Cellulosispirillum alkaliphilum TaxID=3039283 RepID=UPI002A56777E|nr:glycine betaine ABC transporter substrate-binding protein [Chitinispirillales bacterium ANBcel5]
MKKGIVCLLVASLLILGCAPGDDSVDLVYVEWATEIASTNVVAAVLQEEMGYDVNLTSVSAAAMWEAVATGDVDAMVAAWLPTTHQQYLERTQDRVENLGPNLEGTRIGLVVPDYVEIESVGDLVDEADRFNNQIIGIDPGAGIMSATEEAIEVYDLGDDLNLIEGSGAAMTATLSGAIENNEWVVVTGWTPHWKFARWDLKYLEDPENVYGGEEFIATIVRQNLSEDMPEVYQFLNNFNWTPEDMEQVMIWNEETGADPYQNAVRWIEENRERVQAWIPDNN